MSNLIHLNDENFESIVYDKEAVVLVDFSASWCAPCKQLSPVIEKLADDLAGKVKVCKVDIDEAPNAANKHGIRSVPTLMVFKGGSKTDMAVGLHTKEKILSML